MTDRNPHWLEQEILALPRGTGLISIRREDYEAAPPEIRERIETAAILTAIQLEAGITHEEVREALDRFESWWPDDDGSTAIYVLTVLTCKVEAEEMTGNGFRVMMGDREFVCEMVADYLNRNPELKAVDELVKVAEEAG